MKLLDTILAHKREETELRKIAFPIASLETQPFFERNCLSLAGSVARPDSSGIIAEFKRQSPSRGVMFPSANAKKVTAGYLAAGAAAISVLTDTRFFGGTGDDLLSIREAITCPLLRKDFIIDEYQVYETKATGADAILLIARILDKKDLLRYTRLARKLGLNTLTEVHNEEELGIAIESGTDLIGINNRDLDTLEVNVETTVRLNQLIPRDIVRISESGLDSAAIINRLRHEGVQGFLIGEYFMRNSDPARQCRELIKQLQNENQNLRTSIP